LNPILAGVQHLLFVTGKGGVGKTTVAAALAQRLAQGKRRVLAVEMAGDGSLAARFGKQALPTEPARLDGGLDGVRVETRALVESYFRRLLRVPFLSRRLFASGTFHAVTAAAPGVTEFVVLEHLAQWTAAGWFGRRAQYDTVVVDGPASGHALRLLRTPQQLTALVPRGPLSSTVNRLGALLADHDHTGVLLVAIPEEMAISETLEARAVIDGLGLSLARPVLNRVWPRRFSAAEATAIEALRRRSDEPLLAAAGLEITARHEAERHLGRLRRAFGTTPLSLHEVCRNSLDSAVLSEMGRSLVRGLFDDAA
jgi:anion-transporting  ArsA/GET3 family ATPase